MGEDPGAVSASVDQRPDDPQALRA
ncbi:MAG: hypothetical protein QOD44_3847, partial [Solirubrobacteraceae bacterium]|nr:hypothetical protein [Solirubrobacteraceae bacterium]